MTKESQEVRFVLFSDLRRNELENARVAKQVKGDAEAWANFKRSISERLIHLPSATEIGGVVHLTSGFRRVLALEENGAKGCQMMVTRSTHAAASDSAAIVDHTALNVTENYQRKDLDWTELAMGVQKLAAQGLKNKEIEARFGMTASAVSQYRTIAECPPLLDLAIKRYAAGKQVPSKNDVVDVARCKANNPELTKKEIGEMFADLCEALDVRPAEGEESDNGKKASNPAPLKPRKGAELMATIRLLKKAKEAAPAAHHKAYDLAVDVLRWTLYPKTVKNLPEPLVLPAEETESDGEE